MWKSKKTYLLIGFGLIGLILLLSFAKTKWNEAKLHSYFNDSRKYSTPPADETVAILFYPLFQKRDVNTPIALIGDKEQAERITGWTLKPKKIIEGRDWVKRIVDEYSMVLHQSKEKGFYEGGLDADWSIYFVTSTDWPKDHHVRNVAINEDANIVWDNYMKSRLLKKYFDELGLTPILLENRRQFRFAPIGKYRVPPTDKTVAILLYQPYVSSLHDRGYNHLEHPIALFGDKELAAKLMATTGRSLELNKVFEGRDWLVKIMDAYRTALKEAEEKNFRRNLAFKDKADIIFLTAHKGYMKGIFVDANTVCDGYMESELLKTYFDELGLTKELLAAEPNKAPEN